MLCSSCNQKDSCAKGLCHNCYQRAFYHRKKKQSPPQKWSYRFISCLKCGTVDSRHVASGLCEICYSRSYSWEHRLEQYGITIEQYNKLLFKQNGVCAICGQPETRKGKNGNITLLSIDHDHKTDKIRGLLCFKCNTGLGLLGDGNLLEIALNYIEQGDIQ